MCAWLDSWQRTGGKYSLNRNLSWLYAKKRRETLLLLRFQPSNHNLSATGCYNNVLSTSNKLWNFLLQYNVRVELADTCSGACRASFCLSWKLRPALFSVKVATAAWPACGTLNTSGTLPMPIWDFLPHSKSITAPAFSRKSVPSKPAASVGRKHTRNVWVNLRSLSTKVIEVPLCPGLPQSHHTVLSRLDMPGRKIETFEPVSIIRLLFPFYFKTDSGSAVLQHNRYRWFHSSINKGVEVKGTVFFHTSYSCPWFFSFPLTSQLFLGAIYSPGNANVSNVRSGSFFLMRLKDWGFSFVW